MVRIRFESIKVNSLSESSSVNSGLNLIIGRTSTEENHDAMGTIDGKGNRIEGGLHIHSSGQSPR